MQLDPPAQEGEARRRPRGLLVWSGLTLLAVLAMALAMVIASLALELGSEPAPPPPRRSRSARRAASKWPSERPAVAGAGKQQAAMQKETRQMNNQHAGLSQALAEQHITERHEQAAHARLSRDARPARRRKRWAARGWWRLVRWPGVATDQSVRRPHSVV